MSVNDCVYVCVTLSQSNQEFSRQSMYKSTSYSYYCFLMVQPTTLGDVRLKAVSRYLTVSFIIISHIELDKMKAIAFKKHAKTSTVDSSRTFLSACRLELTEINWDVPDNKKETGLKQTIMK